MVVVSSTGSVGLRPTIVTAAQFTVCVDVPSGDTSFHVSRADADSGMLRNMLLPSTAGFVMLVTLYVLFCRI